MIPADLHRPGPIRGLRMLTHRVPLLDSLVSAHPAKTGTPKLIKGRMAEVSGRTEPEVFRETLAPGRTLERDANGGLIA
jgi:hypothetical protein